MLLGAGKETKREGLKTVLSSTPRSRNTDTQPGDRSSMGQSPSRGGLKGCQSAPVWDRKWGRGQWLVPAGGGNPHFPNRGWVQGCTESPSTSTSGRQDGGRGFWNVPSIPCFGSPMVGGYGGMTRHTPPPCVHSPGFQLPAITGGAHSQFWPPLRHL